MTLKETTATLFIFYKIFASKNVVHTILNILIFLIVEKEDNIPEEINQDRQVEPWMIAAAFQRE